MPVTKKLVENYMVRANGEFASISLDCWSRPANGGKDTYYCGEITINSSFGAWGAVWTACANPFKQFLQDLDFGYAFGKFLGAKLHEFCPDKTKCNLLREVLDRRKRGDLTKKDARVIWDEIEEVFAWRVASEAEFVDGIESIRGGMHGASTRAVRDFLSEPWEFIQRRPIPAAVEFWRLLWPEFIAHLKAETEGASAASLTPA